MRSRLCIGTRRSHIGAMSEGAEEEHSLTAGAFAGFLPLIAVFGVPGLCRYSLHRG